MVLTKRTIFYSPSSSVDLDEFVVECRSRLRTGSAFDSYSIAAEAFSEKHHLPGVI